MVGSIQPPLKVDSGRGLVGAGAASVTRQRGSPLQGQAPEGGGQGASWKQA